MNHAARYLAAAALAATLAIAGMHATHQTPDGGAGCLIDAPLPPAAAAATTAQRTRLGASDPGGDIRL